MNAKSRGMGQLFDPATFYFISLRSCGGLCLLSRAGDNQRCMLRKWNRALALGVCLAGPVADAFEVDGFVMPSYQMQTALSDQEQSFTLIGVEFARIAKNFSLDFRYGLGDRRQYGVLVRLFQHYDFTEKVGFQFGGAPGFAMDYYLVDDALATWELQLMGFARLIYYFGGSIGVSLEGSFEYAPFRRPMKGNPEAVSEAMSRAGLHLGLLIEI